MPRDVVAQQQRADPNVTLAGAPASTTVALARKSAGLAPADQLRRSKEVGSWDRARVVSGVEWPVDCLTTRTRMCMWDCFPQG